jgi:hypothetical protein
MSLKTHVITVGAAHKLYGNCPGKTLLTLAGSRPGKTPLTLGRNCPGKTVLTLGRYREAIRFSTLSS